MNKFAYFNPPDLRAEEVPPPPPPSLGDFWRDSLSLLDLYCERNAVGWWQEPLNTWSSLLFLLAAFAAFAVCRRRLATGSVGDRTRLMLCLDLSVVGVASWAFHASGWTLFVLLDVLALVVFTIRAGVALLVRGLAFKGLQAFWGIVAIFALAPLFSYLPLVGDYLQGSNFYLSPILTLGLVALLMRHRANDQRGHQSKRQPKSPLPPDLLRSKAGLGLAFAVLATSLTLRALDLPLCASWTYGTHFLWHALNALAMFLVIVYLPRQALTKNSGKTLR